jgi:heme exporter protein CcmB
MSVLRDALVLAEKDLRLELRTKEILLTMGYFGFLCVLVLAFAFRRGEQPPSSIAAGCLWVAIAFAGTLGLGRAFEREREGDVVRALLLTPVSRPAIYLGKAIGILSFMLVVELLLVPAAVLFFTLPVDLPRLAALAGLAALGTLGYAIVGTLLAASLMRARGRDVLLVVVLFPVIIPVIIAGAIGTAALFDPVPGWAEVATWAKLLGAYDLVFLVASLWIFEALVLD